MRKELFNRIVAFILISLIVVSLGGCGNEGNQVENAPVPDATDLLIETDAEETKTTDSMVEETQEVGKNESSLETEAVDNVQNVEDEEALLEEERLKEEEESLRAEEEARQKDEAERLEAEKKAKEKEEEERIKAEEEAKAKEEEERIKAEEDARRKAEEEKVLEKQRKSFSMMYYLAITAEEIRTSKDNRLALEDIYDSLINEINPDAIDEKTQEHLQNLRDIIKSYISISIKRDRLQFIYNQEKASAIRNAVPNPLSILSLTNSVNWRQLAITVVYTAVDSYNNYTKAGENAELDYIMSGWELDDEERDTIAKNRERAFNYMVDMVQEYQLDGKKTLNEKAIEQFAKICTIENPSERIKLLRAEESSYKLLGNYWLELAEAYFEISQYEKCLECVTKYNELATGIYLKDYNYLQILPKAIVAAQQTYSGGKYISVISEYADAIIENTTTEDWSSRYFAAQVYLDLYAKTNNQGYLEKAYEIISVNVAQLLEDQREINNTYLNPVKEQTVTEPDYRFMTEEEQKEKKKEFKEEERQVNAYNKALKDARKTELPALYEPLILNCELLFALADKIGIDENEINEIEAILQTSSNKIFMVNTINDFYSFTQKENSYSISIEFKKDEIIIPVHLLTAESEVTVTVTQNGETFTFNDCAVDKVEREGTTIDTFYAHIISKQLRKYNWNADSKIKIDIVYGDAYGKSVSYNFTVDEFKDRLFSDKVVFKAA